MFPDTGHAPSPFPEVGPVANRLRDDATGTRELLQRLRDSLREGDLAFGTGDATASSNAGEWRLEPCPLILTPPEWRALEAATRQRVRLVQALLEDVYQSQTSLSNRLIPPELVLSDPFFRRACCNLPIGGKPRAPALRIDFIRTAQGWRSMQTFTNTPLGFFLCVQNRRLMAQEADTLYASLPQFHGVSDLPLRLLEALKAQAAPGVLSPSVIVLSSGPGDPYYAEHSFLARKMGVPLAQGDDLIVLDQRVYFKSIEGLEPVDVIYRRLHDAHIDPVAFPTDRSFAGVAGLLNCIRAGTVAVANSIGSGFAENRGIDAYLPKLTRTLLGERLLVPPLETFYCGDKDQLAHVLELGESVDLLPVHDSLPAHPIIGSQVRTLDRETLTKLVAKHPALFVGQGRAEPVHHPTLTEGTPGSRPIRLSIFAFATNDGIRVIPGGLGVLGALPGESILLSQSLDPSLDSMTPGAGGAYAHPARTSGLSGQFPLAIGTCCDVLVLRDDSETEDAEVEPASLHSRSLVLGSRAAENLFWLGRYAERAENTARMLQLMTDIGIEDLAASERDRWFVRWRSFLEATGHNLRKHHNEPRHAEVVARHVALHAENPSSMINSVELIWENARRARDFLSPECWRIISRLHTRIRTYARSDASPRAATDAAIEEVLNLLPAMHGTIDRTMPSDAGLRFLRTGCRIERCITTAAALRFTFEEVEDLQLPPHNAHPHLGATVRLLVSQDAFRRCYQAPATPALVAEFFLRNRESPQSIEHGLSLITGELENIGAEHGIPESPPRLANAHLRFVREIPLDAILTGSEPRPLSEWFDELMQRLFALSDSIGDFYMNHQARFCA